MKADEIFAHVTENIIASIEAGLADGKWEKPWVTTLPTNAVTGKSYQGMNTLELWVEQDLRGFRSGVWATYKQWQSLGAQVRKGEHGTGCIKWVSVKCKDHGPEERCKKCGRMAPVGFTVFNAYQVDGYELEITGANADPVPAAEAFFAAVGAQVDTGFDRACFIPTFDRIQIPALASFTSAEAYYATLAHEHIHWTGATSRLDRTFGKRFGDQAYAFEELVAELGAAFLCAQLGITDEPRIDHAQYLKHWLTVLRSDPKALYTAASQAQKAVDHLVELATAATVEAAA